MADGMLEKKVGPLPAGVWAAAIGAGLLLAIYMRRTQTSSGPAISDESAPRGGSAVGNGSVGGWTATTPGALQQSGYADNEAWRKAATNYLISLGYDPVASDTALRRYLGGRTVSALEQPLINKALAFMGPPPQKINVTPGPITPPNDNPPSGGGNGGNTGGGIFSLVKWALDWVIGDVAVSTKNDGTNISVGIKPANDKAKNVPTATVSIPSTWTVKTGDTLESIAKDTYGSSLQADRIYNANLNKITDANNLVPGTVLTIPQ